MSFILRLTWKDIVDLLGDAKLRIYISAPGIDYVLADGLLRAHNRGVKVFVCIDNSEDVSRNELKGLINLEDVHLAQAKNYLVAYDFPVGLLINFGAVSLQYKKCLILNTV